MDFTGKNVLIAGGAGFIGTNLALALADRNARLRLTIHEKPLQALIPGAEILALDLRRPEHCAQAVEGMDYVFLAAAHTSGAAVIRTTPLVHITPNVLINTLMLEAAHRAYGRLPWRELLSPASELARAGVELTRSQAHIHAVLDPIIRAGDFILNHESIGEWPVVCL